MDHRRWSEEVNDDLEVVECYGKDRLKCLMNWWRNIYRWTWKVVPEVVVVEWLIGGGFVRVMRRRNSGVANGDRVLLDEQGPYGDRNRDVSRK